MNLQILSINDIIIFAIKIPIVEKTIFNLYQLIPLPIQHKNTSIFSYIEPKQQYILLSKSKTVSSPLQDLSRCTEYLDQQFLCKEIHTHKRTDQPTCEVQLLSAHQKQIPDDCQIRNIKAEIETWKFINNNQWLYVLQKPVSLTLLCDESQNHMEDVVLHQTGLLQLQPLCKGYTDHFVLEATRNINKNITHQVPTIDILEDDCCLFENRLNKTDPIHLTPIKLTNIDLGELRYANKKLKEFDQIVTEQLNKPFVISHSKWYTIALSIIGSILVLIIVVNCCKWCGCINLIKRLLCFTRSPRNGEILPPIIKTFVNCTFDSDIRSEYRNQSRDVVSYDGANVLWRDHQVSTDEELEDRSPPTVERELEVRPCIQQRHGVQPRRSTTPL